MRVGGRDWSMASKSWINLNTGFTFYVLGKPIGSFNVKFFTYKIRIIIAIMLGCCE